MPRFLIHHRHDPDECSAAFASWRGFTSPLRGSEATASCRFGGHELWWRVDAADSEGAMAMLPRFVAERAVATRVEEVPLP